MRGQGQRVYALALAVATLAGCEAVKGLADSGPVGNGEDAAVTIDAAPGAPDATPMPPGRVTVKLFDDHGDPVAGATVVFNAASGAQLSRTTTNATGTASAEMIPAGSSVTVAASVTQEGDNEVRHQLNTIVGVQPGDILEIGPRTPRPKPDPMGALRLGFSDEVSGANEYSIHIGCEDIGVVPAIITTNIPLGANECNRGLEPVDVLLVAKADERVLAIQDLRDVVLDGTPRPANNWSNDFETHAIKLDSVPGDVLAVTLELGLFRRGLDYAFGRVDVTDFSASETTQHDFVVPPEFSDLVQARAQIAFGTDKSVQGFAMLSFTDSDEAGTTDIDLATELPPRIQGVQLEGTGAELTLQFTKTGSTNGMDAGGVGLRWTDSVGTGGRVTWEWNLMLPPGAMGGLPLPRLPPDVVRNPANTDNAWPPPTTAALIETLVGFLETPLVLGYGDFRANRGFSLFDNALPAAEATEVGVARVTVGGKFSDDFQP